MLESFEVYECFSERLSWLEIRALHLFEVCSLLRVGSRLRNLDKWFLLNR